MPVLPPLPKPWRALLDGEMVKPYMRGLEEFLEQEYRDHTILPASQDVFAALELTSPQRVKVVLLGQDPYPTPGHAHGLCFSVTPGTPPPPSLRNMFIELAADLRIAVPGTGCLTRWAMQGVLLLNTVLTVRAGQPLSHRRRGWEIFTDAIIGKICARAEPVVFALWGGQARKKSAIIAPHHIILTAAHPSPLSAKSGFFGARPFSRINEALVRIGSEPIDWSL